MSIDSEKPETRPVRLDAGLCEKVDVVAKQERRTFKAQVEILVEAGLKAREQQAAA